MPSVKFHEYPPSGSRVITCGRTDMTHPVGLGALGTSLSRLKLYVLHTQFIYVFCVDLRTNSDYFTVQN